MKKTFSRLISIYFEKYWIPATSVLSILLLLSVNEMHLHVPFVSLFLVLALLASLLGALVAVIVHFVKGRRKYGFVSIALFLLVGYIAASGFSFLLFHALFNNEPDDFGKDIVIPAGMQVHDPVENFDEQDEPVTDSFTDSIIAAFRTNGVGSTSTQVSTDLAVLNEFGTTNRQKLIQHLASSPRWFVTEENKKSYAYRRLVTYGRWKNSLNGYYTSFEVGPSEAHFQTRIIIAFDGPVFVGPFRQSVTEARAGSGSVAVQVINDTKYNQGKESYFVLRSARGSVEIFEQSRLDGRPVTQLALAEIKSELEAALVSTNEPALGEEVAPATGEPNIELANGMQGGIYHVRAFVNPGEAGRVYLKVFEATRNTPLSAERLKPRSTSTIGWSTNSNEKFRYQSEITVYEGDWGNYYPARFELWFVPDSGANERKLIEKIFRIEGWMR